MKGCKNCGVYIQGGTYCEICASKKREKKEEYAEFWTWVFFILLLLAFCA